MKNLFANWKTTLAGAITGGTISIDAFVQEGISKGWRQALIGLAIILIGIFAKDGDVTGIGASATNIEQEALPIVAQLTATSTNPTMEDVHKVISALTTNPAIVINGPAAAVPPPPPAV